MHGPKHLALTFLLGALLVGGALGFTADRLMVRDRLCARKGGPHGMRAQFGKDLGLTPQQQVAIDSILDRRHTQITQVLGTVDPKLEQIKDSARQQMRKLLTPEQQKRFDDINRRMSERKRGRR